MFREDRLLFGKVFFDMDNDGKWTDEHFMRCTDYYEDRTVISTVLEYVKGVRPGSMSSFP